MKGWCDARGLVDRIAAAQPPAPVPVLAMRMAQLERVAWRQGRPAARRLERRAARALADAAQRALRRRDLLAHTPQSDVFLAALVAPTRGSGPPAGAADARAALARLSAALAGVLEGAVEGGWTLVEPGAAPAQIETLIAQALERGRRERERYDFFSALGHELRTPLSSIRGYLETLIGDPVDAPTQRRFLEIAHAEALRLGRLVDGMFDVSLLDARAFPADASSDPAAAIDGALAAVAPFARRRRVALGWEVRSLPAVAMAQDRLTQVLVNVVENGVKHGREGGTVAVGARPDGRFVSVAVEDDGPGIGAADREAIFDFLRRGPTAAAGTGIGLAVARMMLDRHGGSIRAVPSAALGGACFVVTVPRYDGGKEEDKKRMK